MTAMVTISERQPISTPMTWEITRTRRIVLGGAIVIALATGAVIGSTYAPAAATDPDLLVLVRFMAFVKTVIALSAAAIVAWRFGSAIARPLSATYIASVSLMALAPGLIWYEALLPLASGLFHSGLLLGLALAAGDGLFKRRASDPAD
jgi:hypothetical protein